MTTCVTWSERWPTEGEVRAAFISGRPLELLVRLGGCVRGGDVRGPLEALAAALHGAAWAARFAGAPCVEPYGAPVGAEVDDGRR